MRKIIVALAAFVMMAAGAMSTANAVEFGIGPGGVYAGPDHPYYRHYGDRYYGGCRTVITHRTNRFGEDVVVRQRICD